MTRLRPALAGVVVALALTVAACGDNPGSPATVPVGSNAAASATTAATGQGPTTSAPTTSAPTPGVGTASPGDVKVAVISVADVRQPVDAVPRPGDTALYLVSQPGNVLALRNGQPPVDVLDITDHDLYGGEQGLLGLAFSPDGTTAYVNYTDLHGDGQIDAYRVGTDGAFDPASRRGVYHVAHPSENTNHNGGNLVTGPDGMLYFGTGDGGGRGDPNRTALDLSRPLGKIMRIDPTPSNGQSFTVPAGNPFVGRSGALGEIWAYGVRNPWRFAFDKATGDFWLADVGQNTLEEVDFAPASTGAAKGLNFGWSAYEGTERFNDDQHTDDATMPIYTYEHQDDNNSIIGGFVYRGTAIPGLVGAYVFGDAGSGRIWALRLGADGKTSVAQIAKVGAVSSFGQDADGELYATSLADNAVYKIIPAA